jgi:hypothetical protein
VVRIILNIVAFQVAWWSCVLSARADAVWIGLIVAAGVFALHLVASPLRSTEAWFIPLAAALGYAMDTLATLLGALQFDATAQRLLPAPLWVAALWLAFATTLNTTFVWLRKHLIVAAVLGAASGPLSYAAGAALGVVTLPDALRSVIVLGVFWGVTLPILVVIAGQAVQPRPSSTGPLPNSGELT